MNNRAQRTPHIIRVILRCGRALAHNQTAGQSDARIGPSSARTPTRRPFRSSPPTIGSLAVAVAAVISLVGISYRFEASFLEVYQERGADLVVQREPAAQCS